MLVVVAGIVVCGSDIAMETDAGVRTALAAERNNMATTQSDWTATRQTYGFFLILTGNIFLF